MECAKVPHPRDLSPLLWATVLITCRRVHDYLPSVSRERALDEGCRLSRALAQYICTLSSVTTTSTWVAGFEGYRFDGLSERRPFPSSARGKVVQLWVKLVSLLNVDVSSASSSTHAFLSSTSPGTDVTTRKVLIRDDRDCPSVTQ